MFRDYQLGTGSIGGWEHSELRGYCRDTLLPLVPENVRAEIKTVLKSHSAYDKANKNFTQTTEDNLWFPSYSEMFGDRGSTNQPRYKALFPDKESRKKSKIGNTSTEAWWLRSTYGNNSLYKLDDNGGNSNSNVYFTYGVPLCFCT